MTKSLFIIFQRIAETIRIGLVQVKSSKEKKMIWGALIFSFDPKRKIIYLIDSVQQVKWEFKVMGKEMHGTLTSKGKLFRIVDLKRED